MSQSKKDNVTVKSYSINPTFTLSEFRVIQEYVVRNVGRLSNGRIPSFKWARGLILKEVGLLKSDSQKIDDAFCAAVKRRRIKNGKS